MMNREQRIEEDKLTEVVEFNNPEEKNGVFSNLSEHEMALPNPFSNELVIYKSAEHRYQAMKAATVSEHNFVLAAFTPKDAEDRGKLITIRNNWGDTEDDICWYVLLETVTFKALQNPLVKKELISTGDRAIWENSPDDDVLGIRFGDDYSGSNLLGKAWMYARVLIAKTTQR